MEYRIDRRWLTTLIVVGLCLRFWDLGGKSLWLDEAYSVWRANQTVTAIWTTESDPHPPLYYLVLHKALEFGTGEATARWPSAAISVVSMALLFVVARRLAGSAVAWLAAALLALSPLDLWYAQEARMYAFVAAAGLVAALGFVTKPWVGSLLVAVGLTAGMYFDYLMLPLWVVMTAAWLAFLPGSPELARRWPAWIVGTAAAAVATRPIWAPAHAALSGHLRSSYLAQDVDRFFGTERVLQVGYPLLLVGAGLSVMLVVWAVRVMLGRQSTHKAMAVSVWLAFVVATAVVPVPRLYTVKKVASLGWPFVILCVAGILIALPARWRKIGINTALAVSLAAAVVNVAVVQKDDWRGVAQFVRQQVPAGEAVWLDPPYNELPYLYYAPAARPESSIAGASLASFVQNDRAVWLIVYKRFGLAGPATTSRTWLDGEARLTRRVGFAGLEALRYEGRQH